MHSATQPVLLRFFRVALCGLGWFEVALASVALVAITAINVVGVTLRYGFNSSLIWSEEISLLVMQTMVFVGAAAMYKARGYVVLDFVFDRLPTRFQHGLAIVTWVLASVFASVVCYQAISLYPIQIRSNSFTLGFPVFYFTLPCAVAAASIALTSTYYALSMLFDRGDGADVGELDRRSAILPYIEDGA